MRIFISWSKSPSKEVAAALHDWLPLMFDDIKPWMSEKDIGAGQRGLPEIESSLQDAGFGIVVITKQNAENPWINFEAGALSKAIDERETRVAPLLVGYDRVTDLKGPIAQMQCSLLTESGVRQIVTSIAAVLERPAGVQRFELAWPTLAAKLEEIDLDGPAPSKPPAKGTDRGGDDMLSEILTHVRELRREASQVETIRAATEAARTLSPWRPSVGDRVRKDLIGIAMELGLDATDIKIRDGGRVSVFLGPGRAPVGLWREFEQRALNLYPELTLRRFRVSPTGVEEMGD